MKVICRALGLAQNKNENNKSSDLSLRRQRLNGGRDASTESNLKMSDPLPIQLSPCIFLLWKDGRKCWDEAS